MPGLLRGMARTAAVVGTANAVTRRQSQRYAEQDQQNYQEAYQQAAPIQEPQDDTNDQIAQLQQLAQLKDQGILTQAEFDAKKTQILGL